MLMLSEVVRMRNRFRAVRERDMRRLPATFAESVFEWSYIRHTRSETDQWLLFQYNGPHDILHWISLRLKNLDKEPAGPAKDVTYWARPANRSIDALIAQSAAYHKRLLADFSEAEVSTCDHTSRDVYNAQDFHYCASLVPKLQSILDYGAGYGRQVFLFRTQIPDSTMFVVDAVEQTYLLQNWVFSHLGFESWEYLHYAQSTEEEVERSLNHYLSDPGGIVHLPTWRNGLIPDNSIDLVMFVWCLYEMSKDAAWYAIETCKRVLKPGGYIYIRDNPHRVSYREDPERELERHGFRLVYYPWKLDEREIHGVPRLYRWVGSDAGQAVIVTGLHLRQEYSLLMRVARLVHRMAQKLGLS